MVLCCGQACFRLCGGLNTSARHGRFYGYGRGHPYIPAIRRRDSEIVAQAYHGKNSAATFRGTACFKNTAIFAAAARLDKERERICSAFPLFMVFSVRKRFAFSTVCLGRSYPLSRRFLKIRAGACRRSIRIAPAASSKRNLCPESYTLKMCNSRGTTSCKVRSERPSPSAFIYAD